MTVRVVDIYGGDFSQLIIFVYTGKSRNRCLKTNRISLVILYDEDRENLFIARRDDRKQRAVRDVLSIHRGGRYQIFLTVVKIFVNPGSVQTIVYRHFVFGYARARGQYHTVSPAF